MKMSRIAPLLAAGALFITACGDDDDGGGATTQPAGTTGEAPAVTTAEAPAVTTAPPAPTAGTTAPPDTTAGTTAPPATTEGTDASGAGTVTVADNAELGPILADAEGRTLYLFENDNGLTTACTGGCAEAWPAFDVADPTAGDGVDQSLLETAATEVAENHVAYNGHLLYYFASDAAPGDATGHGLPGWYAVTPEGEPLGEAEGISSDPGYDY